MCTNTIGICHSIRSWTIDKTIRKNEVKYRISNGYWCVCVLMPEPHKNTTLRQRTNGRVQWQQRHRHYMSWIILERAMLKRIPKPKTKKGWSWLASFGHTSITLDYGDNGPLSSDYSEERCGESDLINAQPLWLCTSSASHFSCSICCASWRALWFRYDHKIKKNNIIYSFASQTTIILL